MAQGADNRRPGALAGWRVLEIADGVAAAFCSKALADLGADVVKVEPPAGHPSRTWGPRRPDAAPEEPGGRFIHLNTGKASVVVGEGPAGDRRLRQLASACDVVVTDRPAARLDVLGRLDDATTLVAITPFGATGPYAGYRAHHLITFHAGGEGSILPSGAGFKQFPSGRRSKSAATSPSTTRAGTPPSPCSPPASIACAPGGVSRSTSRSRSPS